MMIKPLASSFRRPILVLANLYQQRSYAEKSKKCVIVGKQWLNGSEIALQPVLVSLDRLAAWNQSPLNMIGQHNSDYT